MNNLFRELAPVSAPAWQEIENEARRTLKTMLAARRIVDLIGPQGRVTAAVGTGRTVPISAPTSGAVEARLRQVQPLVEMRAPFELARSELEAIERGARDANLDPVVGAARKIAIAEDAAIFHGYPAANIRGICEPRAGAGLTLSDDYEADPVVFTSAINKLRDAGVEGPYALALSQRRYTGLTETTKEGYPILEHVRRIVEGPIVWAPGLVGAAVVSLRGGDFELFVGQDFSIGYLDHDAKSVRLYIEESFTFRLLSPQAAVALADETDGRKPSKSVRT